MTRTKSNSYFKQQGWDKIASVDSEREREWQSLGPDGMDAHTYVERTVFEAVWIKTVDGSTFAHTPKKDDARTIEQIAEHYRQRGYTDADCYLVS